jgi:hypothetical protein
MKVDWVKAAGLAIAVSLGGPLAVSAQSPYYYLSDAVEPASYERYLGSGAMPPAPLPHKGHASCAGAACGDGAGEAAVCEPFRVFCQKDRGVNVYGWLAGGIMGNQAAAPSSFNGPVTFADRDDGQFNQAYGVIERTIDTGGYGWDLGGRIDVLYGSDYIFTQAIGLELRPDGSPHWNANRDYGLALPQAYAEIGYNDLSVKLGHFYTVLGYEVVPATGNFFYSHAYTMQYGEPFTHTGVLATWAASENLSLIGGFVNGWDAFDREVDTGAGLAGFAWAGDRGINLAFNLLMSPNEPTLVGTLTNRNVYSVVLSWDLNDQWQYVLQHDLGWQQGADPSRDFTGWAEWYGVNQYLFYTINECWKAGARIEWFRDDDGVRVGGLRPGNPMPAAGFVGNFYALTLGINWTPTSNLIVRPEVRYDWFDGDSLAGPRPYDDGDRDDQFLYGLDVILLW